MISVVNSMNLLLRAIHISVFLVQLLFSNRSEVANAAHNTALFVYKKFGVYSHLLGNSLCSSVH